VFDNVEKKKRHLLDRLEGLDVKVEERSLSDSEKLRNTEVISALERPTLLEEASRTQKLMLLQRKDLYLIARSWERLRLSVLWRPTLLEEVS
jgi:hypothetical protein